MRVITRKLFTKGLALGKSFINRKNERALLKARVLTCEHTWIAAPRRYGKTSLAEQVRLDINKSKQNNNIHSCVIDLMTVKDITRLQEILLSGISELLIELETVHKKLLLLAREYFGNYVNKVSFDIEDYSVKFHLNKPAPDNLNKILLKLDEIALKHDIQFLLIFDEFQKVAELKDNETIEGSIRHAAQEAKNVTYIFSGSQRSLLAQMFTGTKRPLYRLCTQLDLGRINENEYKKYINKVAILVWACKIDNEIYDGIFELTKLHPYYMSGFCRVMFDYDTPIEKKDIPFIWEEVVTEDVHWLSNDYNNLPPSQATLLYALAKRPVEKTTTKEFIQYSGLAASSIKSSLEALIRNDMVHRVEDNDKNKIYRILDPGMEWMLKSAKE